MFTPLLLTLLLAACGLYFLGTIKTRDVGVSAARTACEREGLQFLDDSVVIRKTRFARDGQGRLGLQRTYVFEYSDTGNNRLPGWVVVSGTHVIEISTTLRSPAANYQ